MSRRDDARERVLDAIRAGVVHGFDICKHTGMRPGRVYPALWALERDGVIRMDWAEWDTVEPHRRRVRYAPMEPGA